MKYIFITENGLVYHSYPILTIEPKRLIDDESGFVQGFGKAIPPKEIKQEQIHVKEYVKDGRHLYIGVSQLISDLMDVPMAAMESMKSRNEQLLEANTRLQWTIDDKTARLIYRNCRLSKYEKANLWQRIKYVFTGRIR